MDKQVRINLELVYDDSQSTPESIVQSVIDILEAHEHRINIIERTSLCCGLSITDEGLCENCNEAQ